MEPTSDQPEEPVNQSKVNAQKEPRDKKGRFTKTVEEQNSSPMPPLISKTEANTKSGIPPLFSFQITNPVIYLKLLLKKILSNEGVDLRLHIKPLTALLIVTAILGGTYSFGFLTSSLRKVPVIKEIIPGTPMPTPSPNPYRDAAYSGVLRKSTDGKFYLQTGDGQAVNLIIPGNVSLEKYVGKRIFATGVYNTQTQYLTVNDATDLEVLPQQAVIIPTLSPSPTPQPTASPSLRSSPLETPAY